ncbi:hypothetical protein MFIFM68171_05718 [Madurella fahalii]|uniref:DUF7580 domain-containing protein n=1 Tax=Madurella fahalii TaxID=1157608 RepID=A0ABQ0GCL7_9PEZI
MSGLEVAGVVLGILPLAVRALEGYMSVLSSMKHAQRNLRALVRDLETEQLRLQTTCEILLDGVAPPSVIDKLVRTPFGPGWKPYNDRLRLRLWTTFGKFEEQVVEMQEAAEELRAKLGLEADGSTKLTDRLTISRELKRGTSFTLRAKDYDKLLTRIKTANSVLHDLAGQNCSLEPTRRHRSQTRLIRLTRELARSIFNALLGSLAPCSCIGSHGVCLELEHRDIILIPTDSDDEVARSFNFHMVLSAHNNPTVVHDPSAQPRAIRWQSIHARPADLDEAKPESTSTTSHPSCPVTTSASRKSLRRITWAKSLGSKLTRTQSSQSTSSTSQTFTSISSTQTLVEMTESLTISSQAPLEAQISTNISSLCQIVFSSGKAPALDRYGYIADAERRFELRPSQGQYESRTAVTLRTLLSDKNTNLPPFDYQQKLRVALALSANMLHLFSTPWLSRVVTLDDVLFLYEDTITFPGPSKESVYQPFVIKSLHPTTTSQRENIGSQDMPRPVNLTALSLAALLIQVIIGRVVDALDMTDNMDMSTVLSKYEAGKRLSSEVLENGGLHYETVVKWCLDSVLGVAGLENDDYCQKFYGAVVAKLEQDATLTGEG